MQTHPTKTKSQTRCILRIETMTQIDKLMYLCWVVQLVNKLLPLADCCWSIQPQKRISSFTTELSEKIQCLVQKVQAMIIVYSDWILNCYYMQHTIMVILCNQTTYRVHFLMFVRKSCLLDTNRQIGVRISLAYPISHAKVPKNMMAHKTQDNITHSLCKD